MMNKVYMGVIEMVNDVEMDMTIAPNDEESKRAKLLLDKLRHQLEESMRLQKELEETLSRHSRKNNETVIERENVVVIR